MCRLLPILVGRLRYSSEELADLPAEDVADEGAPDRIEDVRPFIYKVKEDDEDGGSEEVGDRLVPFGGIELGA
jgi:hypothetical protein